jgi:hypothetical protein
MHTPEGHLPRDLLSGVRRSRWTIPFYRKRTGARQLEFNFYAAFQQLFGAEKSYTCRI